MSSDTPERITLEQARDALHRSGYLLESRLEAFLRRREFRVGLNETYPDPETGKARELDIYAAYARCWPTGPNGTDNVSFEIVAECVHPPQPVAFITRSWPDQLFDLGDRWDALKIGGDPLHTSVDEWSTNWSFLARSLRMDRYHHYAAKRLSTQYCSFERKKGTSSWMAKHREEDHGTLRKLCDAAHHHHRELYSRLELNANTRDLFLNFLYPVLVVQGTLLDVAGDDLAAQVVPTPHVQFRCSQLYSGRQVDFQIDVVTEEHFPAFVDMLFAEVEKTAARMKRRRKQWRETLATRIDNISRYHASLGTPWPSLNV